MPTTLPAAAPVFDEIPSGTKQGNPVGGRTHREMHNDLADSLEVLVEKIGVSESSAQDTPLANTGLFSDTNGKSKWRQVVNADIASTAAIAFSKLGANVAAIKAVTLGSDLSITGTTQTEMSSGYRITHTPKSASSLIVLIGFVPLSLGQNETATMSFAQNGTSIGIAYGSFSNNEGDAVSNNLNAAYGAVIAAGSTSSRTYAPAWAAGGAYQIDSNGSGVANGLFIMMEYLP